MIKKELLENEKILKDNLYKLKLKYENKVKLFKSNFNTSIENINRKYERLNVFYNKTFNVELNNMENRGAEKQRRGVNCIRKDNATAH